ncbi:SH3 domain-containing protein [Streptomyces sp. NPDC059176]|uniref:SH3 domain-containing protein n=1 Tax=unclassified Streptomyces TaxID=2593676 RepID=UPI0036AEF3F3
MKMTGLRKALTSLAVAVATTGAVVATTGAATASVPTAVGSHRAAPQTAQTVCTVNDNEVNYRGGPGTAYPVLGQVNRGQKMNARGQEGSWVMGDLWGGRTGVWIHVAYLDCA